MTPDEELRELLIKYTEGKANKDEIDLVESRYIQWNSGKSRAHSDDAFAISQKLMWENISTRINIQGARSPVIKLWPRLAGIAAAVAVIVFGIIFFNYREQQRAAILTANMLSKIKPGHNAATLTLANGTKILLADAMKGELAREVGLSISKTEDGGVIYSPIGPENSEINKTNTLSTGKGETFQLRLPDGSRVWLNAASSLTYHVNLYQKGKRIVKLTGEAYFEVSKDKKHSFVVESSGQQVEVLGTHFNINSYTDEPGVKTTLLEGIVRVSSTTAGIGDPGIGAVLLKPEQQAVFKDGSIEVKPVDAEDAIAWKNGYFIFNNDKLEDIMTRLARWYNIVPIYEDESLKKEVFLGTISRYKNISEVLHLLERTGGVAFEIKENKVMISKDK